MEENVRMGSINHGRRPVARRRPTDLTRRALVKGVALLTAPAPSTGWISALHRLKGLDGLRGTPTIGSAASVLVLRPDGLGDVVLTGPLLRELRRALPDAEITLVVSPQALNLVDLCPY